MLHARGRSLLWLNVTLGSLLGLSMAIASCSEKKPEKPDEPGLRIPLPAGDRDEYGPLPKEVMGFAVTRGAAPGYVPDIACKECHDEIWKTYQSVGMSRSFYRPSPDNVIEDLGKPYLHEKTGRIYEMSFRDGKLFQRRYLKDSKGARYAQHEVEVAWIIGSGNHVRTYFSQNKAGEMYESPLSWYTGVGWRMSPGYDHKMHNRFERKVTRTCMFCHNAYPDVPVGSDLPQKPDIFPKELPHGIGCQRCHGPGARHIEQAVDDNAAAETVRDRIFNPAQLPIERRDEVCLACHLQPESGANVELLVRKRGQPAYSHRPGQKLTDYISYLDHGSEQARRERFQINHHGYRLRQSKCYIESKGKLGCVTCHNPHRKVPKKERAAHYRATCLQCHDLDACQMEGMGTTLKPSESDCLSCHMVTARPTDVVHATVTDHLIRRMPPSEDPKAPLAERMLDPRTVKIVPLFPSEKDDPIWELYLGYGESGAPTPAKLERWRAAFERSRPHTVDSFLTIGSVFRDTGNIEQGLPLLEEAARKFPEVPATHAQLGWTLHMAGKPADAIERLQKARSLEPDNPQIDIGLGYAHVRNGDLEQARVALERALAARPNSWQTWGLYADTLMRLRQIDRGLGAFSKAFQLNPDDHNAAVAIGKIYAVQGRHAQLFRFLEQAATHLVEPKLELARYHLTIAQAPYQDPRKALAHAEAAMRQAPDNPRCHLYLAFALLGLPQTQHRALASVNEAAKHGADQACCAALAALDALNRGDTQSAQRLASEFQQAMQQPAREPLRRVLQRALAARMGTARRDR